MEMDAESTFKNISCYAGIVENNILYTFNNVTGQLMSYNLENFTYEIISEFDMIWERRIRIIKIIKSGLVFYLVPQNRKCIFVYNSENGEQQVYGNLDMDLEERQNMCDAFRYGSRILMIPARVEESILLFNIDIKKWDKYLSISDLFKQKNIDLYKNYFVAKWYQDGSRIWSAVSGRSFIFSMNLSDMEIYIYNVQCQKIDDFYVGEKEFWITEQGSYDIFNWNCYYGLTKRYHIDSMDDNKCAVEMYRCIYSSDQMIFAVSNFENRIRIIERNSGICHSLDLDEKLHKVRRLPKYLWGAFFRYKDRLVLLPLSVDKIVVINLIDSTVELHDGEVRQKDYEKYYLNCKKEIMDSRKIIIEDKWYGLKDIIAYSNQQESGIMNKESVKNVGATICNRIIK